MAKGNGGTMWLRRSYNFIDKDPEIDRWRGRWQKTRIKETDLAILAGLSPSTIHAMFGGKTKKPQFSTFAKMAGALGMRYDLVENDAPPNFEKEIPKARDEWKAHKEYLRKKREREARK
jgi:hypothetical protein